MNIKIPRIFIRKLIIGIVLISLSLAITFVIKESLDTQDPESALPIITLTYEDSPIPDVYRSAYEWSFFTTRERSNSVIAVEDMPLSPYDVQPNKNVVISFTAKPSEMRVWRADNKSTDFTEISIENSTLQTPSSAGMYIYRIRSEWVRGYVEYYVLLDVKPLS